LRNSSGDIAIRLCPGLNLEDRSMISAILFPHAQKKTEFIEMEEARFGRSVRGVRTSAWQGTRRRGLDRALIYKNAPVEIHMFDYRTSASGNGGKRVFGDVDFELGVFTKKSIEAL